MSDAQLREVIAARGIPATGIRDFFDLADALLADDAVQRALVRLQRGTLAVLAVAVELPSPTLDDIAGRLHELGGTPTTAADVADRARTLHELLLVTLDGDRVTTFDPVTERLRAWPSEGLPGAAELAAQTAPSAFLNASDSDTRFVDRLAAERAFAAVSSIAELVTEVSREPARQLSRGGLGQPDTKRLAQAMSVELEAVAPLVSIAERAELVALERGHWLETPGGDDWLHEGTPKRWASLATAWQAALSTEVRSILAGRPGVSWGDGLRAYATWLYPAGGTWMEERVNAFARDAELIGVTAHQTVGTAGAAVLAGDIDAAVAMMAELLPAEVGQVYLQHDLSIVSPGPLSPAVDARLRSLADIESRELASTYRVTNASVNRALAAGGNAQSILEFLRGISLTGVPQPLEYLIVESASRYGRVRVGPLRTGQAQSYVWSDDPAMLGTIAVDQSLTPLALVSADGRLTSRHPADVVFWALSDAKYPVAAEDGEGEILHLRRHQLARPVVAEPADPAAALVEKLRAGDGGESEAGHAWLARQLDVAIRGKQTVIVSIAMPGGVVVDYLLEPASVGGGRFRARDRRADIERTLPLSSVLSITPAP
ncbi:helicase-associated domain-containing protein [Glaciibacter sp. 2TAF33]|uniref:helicase-associated domain-containing protein n=1 Tax=Glaciibacter sp. 2TAF33 TaxID=3233015 RepID=UPI003F92FEEB